MNELVSIITPTYRAEPFIAEFLQSVLAQSYSPIEFILVNDGSDDNSEAIINASAAAFRQRGISLRYLRQPHQGQAAAFNLALPQVSGKYLTWADSDDILHADNIRLKVEYMRAHKDCRMLRCNAVEFNQLTGRVIGQTARAHDKAASNIFERLVSSTTYCLAGCYMLETSLFRECYPGLRIPESSLGQNLQMLLPPASRVVCHYIDAVLLNYRRHPGSHYHSQLSWGKSLARLKAHGALLKAIAPYCATGQEFLLSYEPEKPMLDKLRATLNARSGML